MKRLKLEELLLIHEKVIDATGGIKGVINVGALESVLHIHFVPIIPY